MTGTDWDLQHGLDTVARYGLGEELRGEALARLAREHPANDEAAEQVDDDVRAEDFLLDSRQLGDSPGQVYIGGRRTVSMTWMTPFLVWMSALMTVASLILTPLEVSMVSSLPWTVLAVLSEATSAEVTAPATT